ncbi:MAG: CehA/McbA family metallohydrolase [Acidobacteriota bacterium]|nr:CehA/McbA family metallohydrolase [Acidobacteriota bacterium]
MTLRLRFAVLLFSVATPLFAQPQRWPPPPIIQGVAEAYPPARHGGNYMHNYYFPPAPSSTPWAPAWSPDGESIAVAMSGSIWRVDPETGIADELTSGPGYHSLPAWSPDGRYIVFTVDRNGHNIGLAITEVATGETRTLLSDEYLYTDPVISPDGNRLAYVSTKPSGYFNVYVREFADGELGSGEIALTRDENYGKERLYFGSWDMHITPAWMPDSRELLMVSNHEVPLGSGNVIRTPMAADGFDEGVTVLAEQSLYRTRPDVSIDGKRFIYSSTAGAADQFSNLYVQPTDGGSPYKLTFFQHDAFHPRWSPDGEWIAYIDNAGGLPQLALLETYGGKQRTVEITRRNWSRPMGVLSVRTVDDGTGEEVASRIHLRAADGRFYAPPDAFARIGGAGEHSFHQAGSFRMELPVGTLEIEAVRGFEYEPVRVSVEIGAGDVTELTLRLPRITDMAAKGWWSGSTHIHMNYAGNLHNTLENLMFMSAAEDQDVVLEQIANKDNRILDYQHFVPGGGAHPLSTDEMVLVVGQEYRPPFYGHVFYFGLEEHLISPYTTGYEGTGIESLYPSNTDMFRKAKAQGATVGYVHAYFGENDPLVAPDGSPGSLGGAKGYIVDAALGETDAVEWSSASRAGFFPWYATLNNGLRVTAVGGEDSISNMQRSKLVGSIRTYVHTGERGLDLDAFLEGIREGRAVVSCGPLLDFRVNGRIPGDDVHLPESGGEVEWNAWVRSSTPLERAWVVSGGEDVAEVALSEDRRSATATGTVPLDRSGWLLLRAEGSPDERRPLDCAYAQAFTNPVWVTVGDEPVRSAAAAEYSIRWIDRLREMAEAWEYWRSEAEQQHVYAQFDEARAIYEGFLAEARALGRE